MAYKFFFEIMGCDPPLAYDPDLVRHRANEHRHNHQAENTRECHGNLCSLKEPDCEHCEIDKAIDELEMRLERLNKSTQLIDK